MVDANAFIDEATRDLKGQVKGGKALIALSGGVDSSVCAIIAHRAIGDRLMPVYVDTGLMRKGETDRIREIFSFMKPRIVDASDQFFAALKGSQTPR